MSLLKWQITPEFVAVVENVMLEEASSAWAQANNVDFHDAKTGWAKEILKRDGSKAQLFLSAYVDLDEVQVARLEAAGISPAKMQTVYDI